MDRKDGERLTPGTRLVGGGIFICRADDEGAWVAWPDAPENEDNRPSMEAVCWDEIEVHAAAPYCQCNHCEWRSDDDGRTPDIKGRPVPANPDAEHGDPCPLCGSDEDWTGRLAGPCTRCLGTGFDGRCFRCGGSGREPLP